MIKNNLLLKLPGWKIHNFSFRSTSFVTGHIPRCSLSIPFTVGKKHWQRMQCHSPTIRKMAGFLQKQLCNFIEQLNHVTQHDFIFSNHFRHRIARHAAFVFTCWIFFLVSFYIPIKVLPGWNKENFTVNVARLGLLKWLWLRLVNSMLIFLPLLAFAYSVIYFLLPNYFFNKICLTKNNFQSN